MGETDINMLLARMQPELLPGEYVFCTVPEGRHSDHKELQPIAWYAEDEGLSLVVPEETAHAAGVLCSETFRCIVLRVHSSLVAVGLTAAVSSRLAAHGIPANMIAAFHHDYLLVPAEQAKEALGLLKEIQGRANARIDKGDEEGEGAESGEEGEGAEDAESDEGAEGAEGAEEDGRKEEASARRR